MDINQYKRQNTKTIDIRDPMGNKTDIKVEVFGADSKDYRARLAEVSRRYNELFGKHDALAITALSAVKSWDNVEADGKAVDPESDTAYELASNDDFRWFFDQIWQTTNNRSLFFSKPGKS